LLLGKNLISRPALRTVRSGKWSFKKWGSCHFFSGNISQDLLSRFLRGVLSLSLGLAEKNTQNYHLQPLTVKGLELYL